MLCPRCDGQGTVHEVRIRLNGEIARLCDECEALWREGTEVSASSVVDFSTYVRPLGLRGLFEEVEILPGPIQC